MEEVPSRCRTWLRQRLPQSLRPWPCRLRSIRTAAPLLLLAHHPARRPRAHILTPDPLHSAQSASVLAFRPTASSVLAISRRLPRCRRRPFKPAWARASSCHAPTASTNCASTSGSRRAKNDRKHSAAPPADKLCSTCETKKQKRAVEIDI